MTQFTAVRAYICKHYDEEEDTLVVVDSSGNHYPFIAALGTGVKVGDRMDGYESYNEEELSTIDPDSIEEIEL